MDKRPREGEYWYFVFENHYTKKRHFAYIYTVLPDSDIYIIKNLKTNKLEMVRDYDNLFFRRVNFIKKWEPNWFWKLLGY